MVIISDTSPIINLATIGYLDLIPRLFETIIIPDFVYQEIVIVGKGLPGATEIATADWVQTATCTNVSLVQTLMLDLDRGEAEAIALALELHADNILIDEDLGRRIAVNYKLRPLGVLGILLKAKNNGLIEEIKPVMDDLRNIARFFIHQNLYNQVLKLANE
jgi:uncharacterized protein